MAGDWTNSPYTKVCYGVGVWAILAQQTFGVVPPFLHMYIDVIGILYVGSFASLGFFALVKKSEAQQRLTVPNVWRYPLYATAVLFGIYLALQYLGKQFVNSFLMVYFGYLVTYALKDWLDKLLNSMSYMQALKNMQAPLMVRLGVKMSRYDLIAFAISATITILYILNKHWLIHNLCAIALSLQFLEKIYVGRFSRAFGMLMLFVGYDAYFVFGSTIMSSVATSLDVPIKLLFPRQNDIRFSLLGLGDILIPGVLITLSLRFDVVLHLRMQVAHGVTSLQTALPHNSRAYAKSYFTGSLVGYTIGFILAILSSVIFATGQPALIPPQVLAIKSLSKGLEFGFGLQTMVS